MVDRELELDFAELLAAHARSSATSRSRACRTRSAAKLVGNARWLGVPLADLLEEAGVQPGADQLKSTSVDGWTAGTPVAAIMDGRDAMLASR